MTELLLAIVSTWAVIASFGWFGQRQKVNDCHTDISQLLHDGRIDKDDLRRSGDHSELQRWFDE